MSQRGIFLDVAPGEKRGVVTLSGRPERLLLEREGVGAGEGLGARLVGRVPGPRRRRRPRVRRSREWAGSGVLNFTKETGRPVQGASLEVEGARRSASRKDGDLAGARDGRGPRRGSWPRRSRWRRRLQAFAPEAEIRLGAAARAMADLAQDEAMASDFPLPGGGRIWIEPTRALTAVDVDLGGRAADPRRRSAARAANLRRWRRRPGPCAWKGLGGLVVIDLVGRAHDPAALLAAARAAFAPDNPGVALRRGEPLWDARVGRLPRRARPVVEDLADESGAATPLTLGLALLRALEREALADPGGRFVGVAPAPLVEAARAALGSLNGRVGARLDLRAESPRGAAPFEVVRA